MNHTVSAGASGNAPRSARLQRGQALAEMAILAAVLVPLFLLVPMLAKYAHLRQATQQAARGAAWTATVTQDYKTSTLDVQQQRQLLMDRYFNTADAPIKSAVADGQDSQARLGDTLLNTFSDQPLVERSDIQLQPYKFEEQAGLMEKVTGFIPDWLPGGFPPGEERGLVTSELVVKARDLRTANGGSATYLAPLDNIGLEFKASHTLLVDTWNAAGNGIEGAASEGHERSVWEQVRTLAPGSNLDFMGDTLDGLEALEIIPVLGAVAKLRPGYGQDVVDVVPHDRLQAYEESP
ncbi:TadE/TadG family type IV pilus assembly protein [Lysobacter sp. F6437]|uniref:TadE/TadG family type IV pilus assembly protein n=1 Tax=Lysobacter sp. F6437 TaxID=3459296 RepID=UPI00403E0936